MNIPKEELIAILSQFNPWWRKEAIPDLPTWKRAVFNELLLWIQSPPAPRAVFLSGPRQVGKTTLLLQAIDQLLNEKIPAANILYATFDHPVLKLAGLDAVLEAWRELEPKAEGPEYLFLDEAQFIRDFGTWVKHQVDFSKGKRIIFTGSAMPLVRSDQESGVGRWHTLGISTLSFYEYLQIKKIKLPAIRSLEKLDDLFNLSAAELLGLTENAKNLIGHFHEYLIRGGFPQTALVDSISQSQRLLREDIIDKVLKRDMTAVFGVRRIVELEQMFIFLCMHDGGQQDLQSLASNLGVSKPTVQNFISLFESTHLIYRLAPYGYGKEVLRARYKIYLADAAISSAILLKGKTILENADALGRSVETCVFAHLSAHNNLSQARYSYWQNIKTKEVDMILETDHILIPFEVKYQSQKVEASDVPALIEFSKNKTSHHRGYILTKSPQDIGLLNIGSAQLFKVPASLLCYWIGETELSQKNLFKSSYTFDQK